MPLARGAPPLPLGTATSCRHAQGQVYLAVLLVCTMLAQGRVTTAAAAKCAMSWNANAWLLQATRHAHQARGCYRRVSSKM